MRWAVLGCALLLACGGESESTGSTATGGSGGAATGGSGGATGGGGGSGGYGGTPAGGGSGGSGGSGGGGAGADAGTFECSDGGAIDAGAEAAIAAACVVGVVQVTQIDEECSGAGGAHITFKVVKLGRGSGVTSVNYGGHAYYAPPEGPDNVGEFFVAGIDPLGGLMPQENNPGWCIVGLPAVDGVVHTLIEGSDEADATAKMNAILGI